MSQCLRRGNYLRNITSLRLYLSTMALRYGKRFDPAGVEYCRGYVDEHGQWNNGFTCPQWGGPGRKYCCGTDTHRFCCPEESAPQDNGLMQQRLPMMLGVAVGSLVFVLLTLVGACYFCRCCWLYRRRKRLRHDGPPNITGGPVDYAVNYTVCPHSTYLRDGATSCYPLDDPPPYPGEPPGVSEEKQPLNPTQLCVAIDGPEDVTSPITFSLSRRSPPGVSDPPGASEELQGRRHHHANYRTTAHPPPHRCYHDHVTIFSNIGALGADGVLPSGDGRESTGRNRKLGDRGLLISHGAVSGRQGEPEPEVGFTEHAQVAGEVTEELTGELTGELTASTSSAHYNTHIGDFLCNTEAFTPLTRSHTFSLQERGGIELTTFKAVPSSSTHTPRPEPQPEKSNRRSIELGSFFRGPLGGRTAPVDYSFLRRPLGDATDGGSYVYPTCLQNGNVAHATCLQNGNVPLRLSPEAGNEDEEELTDLTIQVIPQG